MKEDEKPKGKREPRNVIPHRTPQTNGTYIGARDVDAANITEVIKEQFRPVMDEADYGEAEGIDDKDTEGEDEE